MRPGSAHHPHNKWLSGFNDGCPSYQHNNEGVGARRMRHSSRPVGSVNTAGGVGGFTLFTVDPRKASGPDQIHCKHIGLFIDWDLLIKNYDAVE